MMRLYFQLILLCLLNTTLFIIPMEQTQVLSRLITFQKITAIDNPCKVAFMEKNQLMIGYDTETGYAGACIVDWQHNTKIKDIFTTATVHPFCYRNHQRNAVALNTTEKVALYNLDSEKQWELDRELSVSTFTAKGTLYTVQSDGTLSNNKNNLTFKLSSKNKIQEFEQLTAHHTIERIFFTKCLSKTQSSLCTIDLNPDSISIKMQHMPVVSYPYQFGDFPQLIHSPINNTIAVYWPFGDKWSLFDPIQNIYIIENINTGLCRLLAFHPQQPLLAILAKDGFVELYDIKTQKVIASTENSLGKPSNTAGFNKQMIDFSEDGNHIAVIVGGECFVLNIANGTD